jgi:hypothetical protein
LLRACSFLAFETKDAFVFDPFQDQTLAGGKSIKPAFGSSKAFPEK